MDARDFSLRLKKIKAEVLAMKQAHRYGLNSAGFYIGNNSVSFTPSFDHTDIRVVITFDMTKNNMPMFIWSVGGLYDFYGQTWDQNTKQVRFSYSVLGLLGSSSIAVVSTKPIKQIEMEVI